MQSRVGIDLRRNRSRILNCNLMTVRGACFWLLKLRVCEHHRSQRESWIFGNTGETQKHNPSLTFRVGITQTCSFRNLADCAT